MKVSFAGCQIEWKYDLARLQRLYREWHGRDPEIERPQRYTEKIQWRKLYDDNPLFATFCDKWAVRQYIAERVGEKWLVPILWQGTNPNEIPFEKLKLPCVIKTSHASGQVIILTKANRKEWSRRRIIQQLTDWLAQPYGEATLEKAYRHIPPQVLIEKLLLDAQGHPPIERRLFVFDGKVRVINTVLVEDRQIRNGAFHTPKWERLLWYFGRPPLELEFPIPPKLKQMVSIARRLGANCDHLRIDFFDMGHQFLVGEITIYPWSGSAAFKPDEADFIMGKWWNLRHPQRRAWRKRISQSFRHLAAPRPPLRIHLYAVAWNEEKILPYFLRHYTPWVERFFIADHESTDRTPELLQACPKHRPHTFTAPTDSFIFAQQDHGNHCWKQSRGQADWVIICDLDEFLYHPQMLRYLHQAREKGITILPAEGYQMVSTNFPKPGEVLTRSITRGTPFGEMNKTLIFNPDAIEEIHFAPGQHTAQPTGRVVYPEVSEIKLLHYKYLGATYLNSRHQALKKRRLPVDLALNYGHQYFRSEAENNAHFNKASQSAIEVIRPDRPKILSQLRSWVSAWQKRDTRDKENVGNTCNQANSMET